MIVGGLATDFCVAKTARQLAAANFKVIINLQATAAIMPERLESLFELLKIEGILVFNTHEELAEYLTKLNNEAKNLREWVNDR